MKGGWNPLTRNIANDDTNTVIIKHNVVIEIAAYISSRLTPSHQSKTLVFWKFFREKGFLNNAGKLELLIDQLLPN